MTMPAMAPGESDAPAVPVTTVAPPLSDGPPVWLARVPVAAPVCVTVASLVTRYGALYCVVIVFPPDVTTVVIGAPPPLPPPPPPPLLLRDHWGDTARCRHSIGRTRSR